MRSSSHDGQHSGTACLGILGHRRTDYMGVPLFPLLPSEPRQAKGAVWWAQTPIHAAALLRAPNTSPLPRRKDSNHISSLSASLPRWEISPMFLSRQDSLELGHGCSSKPELRRRLGVSHWPGIQRSNHVLKGTAVLSVSFGCCQYEVPSASFVDCSFSFFKITK